VRHLDFDENEGFAGTVIGGAHALDVYHRGAFFVTHENGVLRNVVGIALFHLPRKRDPHSAFFTVVLEALILILYFTLV